MTLTNAANDFVTEYKEKLMLVNQSLQEGSWIINCNIKNSEITPAIIFSPPSNEWKRSWNLLAKAPIKKKRKCWKLANPMR